MKWIGLTGGLGSGKSTVADILRRSGVSVLDADRKAREVLEKSGPAYGPVVEHFGEAILDDNQEVNRSRLAKIVFDNAKEKEWLESVIHPLVQQSVRSERLYLQDQGVSLAFYDVPLLFEKNLQDQFDAVVLVYAPQELQIERVRQRNRWTEDEVQARLQNQISIDRKKEKTKYIIYNTGTLKDLEKEVARVLDQVLGDLEKPVPT
ncbi:MAG: dephospho-CoA kinase [Bdellovibrionia bacterium]